MHRTRADLHFERTTLGISYNGVQGAISVRFRARNIIIKLIAHGYPSLVHQPKRVVAVTLRLNNNPQCAHIKQCTEIETFLTHLVVDAVDMFGPPCHIGCDAHFL